MGKITDSMAFFHFPELPDFDDKFDYSKLETSFLKLKGYVFWFNNTLNHPDVGQDWLKEDEWKFHLDYLKLSIIKMKQELEINQQIQFEYF